MCFFKFIDEDDCVHYKHEVSDTDIICYKTVEARPGSDDYRSRIQGFKYEVGKTYTEDSVPMDLLEKLDMLNDGVHIIGRAGVLRDDVQQRLVPNAYPTAGGFRHDLAHQRCLSIAALPRKN